MLLIGHRGAAALAPENTLEAFESGVRAGADMLEFDVQRTKDGELLVVHDATLFRTHKKATIVRWSSYRNIQRATENGHKIATLKEVLDMYFGRIFLNLEIKNSHVARHVMIFIKNNYITQASDWDMILLSSFKPRELVTARKLSANASLALVHNKNPFTFMLYYRRLHLSAVGFHYRRFPSLARMIAARLELFTYVYTVNNSDDAVWAQNMKIDAIVTDNPLSLRDIVK